MSTDIQKELRLKILNCMNYLEKKYGMNTSKWPNDDPVLLDLDKYSKELKRAIVNHATAVKQKQENKYAAIVKAKRVKRGKIMAKSKLQDLNDMLFNQMHRLEETNDEETLDTEIKRSKAMTSVSRGIIDNANLILKAAKMVSDGDVSAENMLGIAPPEDDEKE